MATTAISFRRGDTDDNKVFAGVEGEIVADLGNGGNIDDGKATIVLHRGDSTAGGIRMAREDFANITDDSLYNLTTYQSEGGAITGLMYNDLHNIQHNNNSQFRSATESTLKYDYNIASQDGHDLSTRIITDPSLTPGSTEVPGGGPFVATIGLSNISQNGISNIRDWSFDWWKMSVDTEFLATNENTQAGDTHGHRGKNLAYADMSNVNTANLATTGAGHSGGNLAYADLTNVYYPTIVNRIDDAYRIGGNKLQNYEWVINKQNIINPYESEQEQEKKYPSIKAIINYTATLGETYVNLKLDNVLDWKIASEKEDLYKIDVVIDNGGSGYATTGSTSTIVTNIAHPDGGFVEISVLEVDDNGKILKAEIANAKKYSSSSIATTAYIDTINPGAAEFTISSTNVHVGKLMKYDLSNSEVENLTDTQNAKLTYKMQRDALSNSITYIDSVSGEMTDLQNNSSGSFSVDNTTNGVIARLTTNTIAEVNDEIVKTKISSIDVTKTNAYLNKNENIGDYILDTDHELLNRGEINSAIQDAMDAAIATAVVFKGIVADETALPSSGQTNGDLYWVTAFSSNPPAGMISGKSGSAIWNANVTPAQWEYKLDNQNAPDNQTLEYSGGSTQQVLKVKIAGTQTEGPNALVVKSDGLYVKTPVETPTIPTADGVYHLYVNNGVVSWVNDTRLQVTNQ